MKSHVSENKYIYMYMYTFSTLKIGVNQLITIHIVILDGKALKGRNKNIIIQYRNINIGQLVLTLSSY